MGFADDMAEHDDEFKETVGKSGGGRLPDGQHQAQLTEFRVEEGTYGWQLCWKFANKRGSVRRWDDLPPRNEKHAEQLKGTLVAVGYTGLLSELREFCEGESLIGLMCDIGIQTKPGDKRDFTNVYVNRAIGIRPLDEATASQSAAAPADDDIPF